MVSTGPTTSNPTKSAGFGFGGVGAISGQKFGWIFGGEFSGFGERDVTSRLGLNLSRLRWKIRTWLGETSQVSI